MKRLFLRIGIVALGALAVLDPRPIGGGAPLPAVVVLDVSRSMGPTRAQVSIPMPGSSWVFARSFRRVSSDAESVDVERDATHLGATLRDVAERFPGSDVLVATDGRAGDEDWLRAVRFVASRGGRVFPVIPDPAAADVGIRSARLARDAGVLRIDARLSSSTRGRAVLRLLREDAEVDSRAVDLRPGADVSVILSDPGAPSESAIYRLVLVPTQATPNDDPGNDALTLVARGRGRRVLVWGDLPADAFQSPGATVRVVERLRSEDVPGNDVIVLSNVPLSELRAIVPALLRFVAGGGRLLVLGGPDAYAGGGWSGSSWERDLCPLHVRIPEGDGLALLLALDRSGSTADASLSWLRDAAVQTVRGVVPGEQVSVLPFSSQPATSLLAPGWVRAEEPERAAELFASLAAIQPGGDTDIPAALEAGARRVLEVKAQVHRLVLLTDGDPDKRIDAASLARARSVLAQGNVSFGAVVVQMRHAVDALRTLAERPEDVVFLQDAARIPAALAHVVSTQRGRRERLENPPPPRMESNRGPFAPLASLRASWAHELRAAEGAQTHAWIGPQSAPFAASRQVGAGRVYALAWGPEVEAAGVPRAQASARLAPLVGALAREADNVLSASFVGEDLVVQAPAGQGALTLRSRDASGEERIRATLLERAPGAYRGREPTGEPASGWFVRGAEQTYGLDLPARPPPESRGSGVDRARLEKIAEAGGGRVLANGSEWSPARPSRGVSLAPWFLLLATIGLVVDRFGARRP